MLYTSFQAEAVIPETAAVHLIAVQIKYVSLNLRYVLLLKYFISSPTINTVIRQIFSVYLHLLVEENFSLVLKTSIHINLIY